MKMPSLRPNQLLTLSQLGKQPLVSILISNYNYENYLGKAIESVLNQSYPHFELIICDDGSTDRSIELIRQYQSRDPRVQLIAKPNGGQGSAFNAAFQRCIGEIVCFLDADDYFEATKLEAVVDTFVNDPTCGAVIHHLRVIDGLSKVIRTLEFSDEGYLGDQLTSMRIKPLFPPTTGLSFRTSLLQVILPLPEERFRIGADAPIINIAAFLTQVRVVAQNLANYRIHGNNFMGTALTNQLIPKNIEKTLRNMQNAMQYTAEFLSHRNIQINPDAVRSIIEHQLLLGVLNADDGLKLKAWQQLSRGYTNHKSDYTLQRFIFWWLVARLPNPLALSLIQKTYTILQTSKRNPS